MVRNEQVAVLENRSVYLYDYVSEVDFNLKWK